MPVLAAPPEAPGAVEVKLLLLSVRIRRPRGSSLLFAVGAGPPHDGVRRARCLNLDHDLASLVRRLWTLNEVASPIVPTGTIRFASWAVRCDGPPVVQALTRATPALGSLPKRNSAPSLHIRWRMTASLRATATHASASAMSSFRSAEEVCR